jgi:hypothetical protein
MSNSQINTFERNQYPADIVYVKNPSFNLRGELTDSASISLNHKIKLIRKIDNAVIVESVDEKTRQSAIKYFLDLKNNAIASKGLVKTEYYKDIGISLFGVAAIIGGFFIPASIPAIAVCTSGLGLTILGISKGIKDNNLLDEIESDIKTMKDQSDEWKDPVIDVIEHRKKAGMEGFQYVYKNNLKNKVIHSEEVQQLWQQNFMDLLSGKQSIQQISDENVLGHQSVEYAWNYHELPSMHINGRYFSELEFKSLVSQFNICRTNFQKFSSSINHEFNALQREKNAIKQEINTMRTRWLLPAEYSYNQSKQTALSLYQRALIPFIHEKEAAINKVKQAYDYQVKNEYDFEEIAYEKKLESLCKEEIQAINKQYDSHPAIISIHQAYERDIRMCDFMFNQSQLVVNTYFDQRIRNLNDAYNRAKTKIEEQKTAGHIRFKYLMDQALANPRFFLSTDAMPTVHQNWSLPNLNSAPSWGEVYGQAPTFQQYFINSVSELAWNHFWGSNGLGRFASMPASSWNNLNPEKFSTPFTNHCFNLNGMCHNPQPGMFTREMRVPIPPIKTPVGTRKPVILQ